MNTCEPRPGHGEAFKKPGGQPGRVTLLTPMLPPCQGGGENAGGDDEKYADFLLAEKC